MYSEPMSRLTRRWRRRPIFVLISPVRGVVFWLAVHVLEGSSTQIVTVSIGHESTRFGLKTQLYGIINLTPRETTRRCGPIGTRRVSSAKKTTEA